MRKSCHHDCPWTLTDSLDNPLRSSIRAFERTGDAETVVVVAVVRPVPVAICGAQVPRIVVPRTATQHAEGGQSGSLNGSNIPPRKIAWRKRHVSACSAWAIHACTFCRASAHGISPNRQRSLIPRSRFRNRRTLASGILRLPLDSSTYPRNVAGSSVGQMKVFSGWSFKRRPSRNPAIRCCQSSRIPGSS